MPYKNTLQVPSPNRPSTANKAPWTLGTLTLLAMAGLSNPAHAVKVSAFYNDFAVGYSNSMTLPGKSGPGIFNPGAAVFTGAPSLAAPLSGTVTDTVSGFAFGSGATPVQITGDAISSVSQPSPGVYTLDLTVTNFTIQSNFGTANEYVYLNVWEDFTNLGLSANWTGGAVTITGSWFKTSTGDLVGIEPIATVSTGGPWTATSAFFGGIQPANIIAGSTPVSTLTPVGGNLSVGLETILLLNNADAVPGDNMILPTSLHLSARFDPAPVPIPAAFWLFGSAVSLLGLSARRRRG